MKASNFGSMLEISIFGRNKPEIEAFQGKVQTFVDSFRLVKVPILQGAAPIKEIARICSQLTEYNEVMAIRVVRLLFSISILFYILFEIFRVSVVINEIGNVKKLCGLS